MNIIIQVALLLKNIKSLCIVCRLFGEIQHIDQKGGYIVSDLVIILTIAFPMSKIVYSLYRSFFPYRLLRSYATFQTFKQKVVQHKKKSAFRQNKLL